MAILHRTTLTPTKLELLAGWLPDRPWFTGSTDALEQVGSYRFDDPDDAVGIETLLLTAGDDTIVQVPLTYRDAPVDALEPALVGTLEHGVLGTRWVYDGTADPVYVRAVVDCVLRGTGEASRFVDSEDELLLLENDTRVRGSGIDLDELNDSASLSEAGSTTTRIETGIGVIDVCRQLGLDVAAPDEAGILVGTWKGQTVPMLLAALQLNVSAIRHALQVARQP